MPVFLPSIQIQTIARIFLRRGYNEQSSYIKLNEGEFTLFRDNLGEANNICWKETKEAAGVALSFSLSDSDPAVHPQLPPLQQAHPV